LTCRAASIAASCGKAPRPRPHRSRGAFETMSVRRTWRSRRLPVGIGVGDAESRENPGFDSLHRDGILLVDMVVAGEVQYPVHDQMGEVMIRPLAVTRRLSGHGLEREY